MVEGEVITIFIIMIIKRFSDYISVNNLLELNVTLFFRVGTPTFAKNA
jgi:hypothetical protein